MSVKTTVVRQNDPRWSGYPYCPGNTIGTAGCALGSLAMALGMSDPRPIADWLTVRGYASSSAGTDHDGIIAYTKACGYGARYGSGYINNQMHPDAFDTMLAHLRAGKKVILLMGGTQSRAGGSCRNDFWSKAGHYVVAYGVSGNNVLIRDPIHPPRDGWHSAADYSGAAEDSLNGNVKIIFLLDIPYEEWADPVSDTDYTFTLPQIGPSSTGAAVKLWQRILKGRGLYSGKIDGKFGDATTAATDYVQKVLGLKRDKLVGPDTWDQMIPMPGYKIGSKIKFTVKEIRHGYKGAEAYFLQNLLGGWGYVDFMPDYLFGDGCKAALIRFQKYCGMAGDGVAGKNSFKRLVAIE